MNAPDRWREATALDVMTSAAVWTACVAFIVPAGLLLMALQALVGPERIDWLARIGARVLLALTFCRVRTVVHPAVDPSRPYVFCQNHVNHFDFCVLYRATPHFKQGLELADHFRYPVYGWFMKQRGTIPVRSGTTGQLDEIRESFRSEIEKGHSIITFPEGRRTRDCRVGDFHKGAFVIARDLGVPIVPVAVTGLQDIMRADSWLIRPGREILVEVLEPISVAGVPEDGIPALIERVRAPIASRVDDYLAGPR